MNQPHLDSEALSAVAARIVEEHLCNLERWEGNPDTFGLLERAILDALSASKPNEAESKPVAPLEWTELTSPREDGPGEPNGDLEAETPFGFYEIEMVAHNDGVVWGLTFGVEEEYIGGDHASPDEAKAAAQADYESRILSALTAAKVISAAADSFHARMVRAEARVAELEAALVPQEASEAEVEAAARAIYELDPFYEGGEWVDSFQVSPGGNLTWEQAKARDADAGGVLLPVTKFAFDAARNALTAAKTARKM